jgi:hypothetical protein
MCRRVLPVSLALDIVNPVRIVYIVIIIVDIDVAVAAPSTIVTPTVAPSGTQNESRPERKSHSRHVSRIDIGRIRIRGRAINDHRIV